MGPLAALLRFPVSPAAATRALSRRPSAAAVLALPPLLLLAWLLVEGCGAGDAFAAAAGLFTLLAGLATAGAAGAALASRIVLLPRTFRERIGPCAAAAVWAVLLLSIAFCAFAPLTGVGSAPLAAAFSILVWGTMAGLGIVESDEAPEGGRGLVASCAALFGSLLGLTGAATLAAKFLVFAVPSPPAPPDFPAGAPILVRPGDSPRAGALLLVRDGPAGPPRLARRQADGSLEATPPLRPDAPAIGRVFFRVAGADGAGAVGPPATE
jgi:hypothetical protein